MGVAIHPGPHCADEAERLSGYPLLLKVAQEEMSSITKKEVLLVLAFIAAALYVSLIIGEKFVAVVVPVLSGAFIVLIAFIGRWRLQRERRAQYLRPGETVAARLATMGPRSDVRRVASYPDTFQPLPVYWGASSVLVAGLVVISVVSRDWPWPLVCTFPMILALTLFSTGRFWVFLHADRLEIQGVLSKVVQDRFGIALVKPTTIYYRNIRILQGLGEHGNLVIIQRTGDGRWKEHLISRSNIENYADLEEELLRRVPAHCKLHPDPQRYIQLPRPFKRVKGDVKSEK